MREINYPGKESKDPEHWKANERTLPSELK